MLNVLLLLWCHVLLNPMTIHTQNNFLIDLKCNCDASLSYTSLHLKNKLPMEATASICGCLFRKNNNKNPTVYTFQWFRKMSSLDPAHLFPHRLPPPPPYYFCSPLLWFALLNGTLHCLPCHCYRLNMTSHLKKERFCMQQSKWGHRC